ncbi:MULTISPECIES: hypothetical protein [unclassified Flavobacterium]|uniref:hypothetical protein n=1 Tax=unclassified Flavobacterium TaxID=196869 RepID=UPI001292B9EA|nr:MULTISPECIES: hypothetical protein [unclassified Flavobacterium]MQP51417.1 hypothetical protein [Flavobacterium sp. LMO9]MQP61355.1 hypothetical protein [Flavobacterium sp. LMO6]
MIFFKTNWLCFFSTIILFCFFKSNVKDGIPYDYVSESLIVGRLMESERSGILSYSGLSGLLKSSSTDEEFKQNSINQFKLLKNKSDRDNYKAFYAYNSQTGGQGMLYSVFNKISPFDLVTNIEILKNFTLLLNAFIFSIFIGWCKRNFGFIPALVVLFFIAFSSWIWLFSSSLYWCLWAFYIPFLTILLGLEFLKSNPNKILALTFISVFLKCFFNGFEYITTTLIAVYVPVIYYYIKDNKKIKDFIIFSFKIGIVVVMGILVKVFILLWQLKQLKGSFSEGINHIIYSYNLRTSSVIIEGKTAEISNNMYVQILIKYLSGDIFSWIKPNVPFVLLLILIFCSCLLLLKIDFKKYKAIVFSTWFSIIAPISWFILFIQHSSIHYHLNFIVWYIPFLPLGVLCLGILANIFIERFTKSIRI